MRILLWCHYDPSNSATTIDSINAILRYSRHAVFIYSGLRELPDVDLEMFDVIVVHHSIALALDSYVSERSRRRLTDYRGFKAAFVQDEYRFIRWTGRALRDCGFRLLFTNFDPDDAGRLYGPETADNVAFKRVLTGYVPEDLLRFAPKSIDKRPFAIGYRGRSYPVWHGQPAVDRVEIGERVREAARHHGLRTNIAWRERDRLYGRRWFDFLRECQFTLAVPSDVAVMDVDGSVSPASDTFVALLDARIRDPSGSGDRPVAYKDVADRFVKPGSPDVSIAQVSPRCFEAVALRTGLILLEGEYSGVLKPERHYLSLRRDYRNLDDVLRRVTDREATAEMIAAAYGEVAMNPDLSYRAFVRLFDTELIEAGAKPRTYSGQALRAAQFAMKYPVRMIENPHLEGRRLRLKSNLAEMILRPIRKLRQ